MLRAITPPIGSDSENSGSDAGDSGSDRDRNGSASPGPPSSKQSRQGQHQVQEHEPLAKPRIRTSLSSDSDAAETGSALVTVADLAEYRHVPASFFHHGSAGAASSGAVSSKTQTIPFVSSKSPFVVLLGPLETCGLCDAIPIDSSDTNVNANSKSTGRGRSSGFHVPKDGNGCFAPPQPRSNPYIILPPPSADAFAGTQGTPGSRTPTGDREQLLEHGLPLYWHSHDGVSRYRPYTLQQHQSTNIYMTTNTGTESDSDNESDSVQTPAAVATGALGSAVAATSPGAESSSSSSHTFAPPSAPLPPFHCRHCLGGPVCAPTAAEAAAHAAKATLLSKPTPHGRRPSARLARVQAMAAQAQELLQSQSTSGAMQPSRPLRSPWQSITGLRYPVADCVEPIDAVYTWVNGSDATVAAAKERALHALESWVAPVAGAAAPAPDLHSLEDNRFRDLGELRYSMRSLLKNAPWFRHIYLVTSGETPTWLNLSHPAIRVIPHKDIFLRPESNAPSFSSSAIESALHRIPGLSDNFVYVNDDVFFALPTKQGEFWSPRHGLRVERTHAELTQCAAGCDTAFIGDGICQPACMAEACEWDLGDCERNYLRAPAPWEVYDMLLALATPDAGVIASHAPSTSSVNAKGAGSSSGVTGNANVAAAVAATLAAFGANGMKRWTRISDRPRLPLAPVSSAELQWSTLPLDSANSTTYTLSGRPISNGKNGTSGGNSSLLLEAVTGSYAPFYSATGFLRGSFPHHNKLRRSAAAKNNNDNSQNGKVHTSGLPHVSDDTRDSSPPRTAAQTRHRAHPLLRRLAFAGAREIALLLNAPPASFAAHWAAGYLDPMSMPLHLRKQYMELEMNEADEASKEYLDSKSKYLDTVSKYLNNSLYNAYNSSHSDTNNTRSNVARVNAHSFVDITVGASAAYCAPGCPVAWIGDGVCDSVCDCESCGYDRGDCDVTLAQLAKTPVKLAKSQSKATEAKDETASQSSSEASPQAQSESVTEPNSATLLVEAKLKLLLDKQTALHHRIRLLLRDLSSWGGAVNVEEASSDDSATGATANGSIDNNDLSASESGSDISGLGIKPQSLPQSPTQSLIQTIVDRLNKNRAAHTVTFAAPQTVGRSRYFAFNTNTNNATTTTAKPKKISSSAAAVLAAAERDFGIDTSPWPAVKPGMQLYAQRSLDAVSAWMVGVLAASFHNRPRGRRHDHDGASRKLNEIKNKNNHNNNASSSASSPSSSSAKRSSVSASDASSSLAASVSRATSASTAVRSLSWWRWPVTPAFPAVNGLHEPVPPVRAADWWARVRPDFFGPTPIATWEKERDASYAFILSRSMALMRKLTVSPFKSALPHKPQVGNKHVYARLQALLPHEYRLLESHRFRDPGDIQFGYALAAFTLGARHPSLLSLARGFLAAFDGDCDAAARKGELKALLRALFTPPKVGLMDWQKHAARERVARWPFRAPLVPPLCADDSMDEATRASDVNDGAFDREIDDLDSVNTAFATPGDVNSEYSTAAASAYTLVDDNGGEAGTVATDEWHFPCVPRRNLQTHFSASASTSAASSTNNGAANSDSSFAGYDDDAEISDNAAFATVAQPSVWHATLASAPALPDGRLLESLTDRETLNKLVDAAPWTLYRRKTHRRSTRANGNSGGDTESGTASDSDGGSDSEPTLRVSDLLRWPLARAALAQIHWAHFPLYHSESPVHADTTAYVGLVDNAVTRDDGVAAAATVTRLLTGPKRRRVFVCVNDAAHVPLTEAFVKRVGDAFNGAFPEPAPWELDGAQAAAAAAAAETL